MLPKLFSSALLCTLLYSALAHCHSQLWNTLCLNLLFWISRLFYNAVSLPCAVDILLIIGTLVTNVTTQAVKTCLCNAYIFEQPSFGSLRWSLKKIATSAVHDLTVESSTHNAGVLFENCCQTTKWPWVHKELRPFPCGISIFFPFFFDINSLSSGIYMLYSQ